MDVKFRLVLPKDLADDLFQSASLKDIITRDDDLSEDGAPLNLGDVATGISIATGVVEIAKVCFTVSKSIIAWVKNRRRRVNAVIQGPRDDVPITIDENTDPTELADTIEKAIRK